MILLKNIDALDNLIGQEFAITNQSGFTLQQLQTYLDLSGDKTALHDPSQMAQPIIPGNMILMRLPALLQSIFQVLEKQSVMTIGYENIQFHRPLPVSCKFDMLFQVQKLKRLKGKTFLWQQVTLTDTESQMLLMRCCVKDMYQ